MADAAQASPGRWGILVGINFYVTDTCLEGCIQDVELAEHYFRTAPWPMDIVTFTATKPVDEASKRPQESADALPTYENVNAALKRVLEKSKQGDLVYIHYSGHGTRKTGTGKYSSTAGNLALVLYDDLHGSRYLYGSLLASALHKMVEKGLLVTIVFDCCFSGSAMRQSDASVRAAEYDPTIEAAYPLEEPEVHEDERDWSLRDGRHLPIWLVDPSGYTIFAACGPHEIAKELTSREQEKRGALSYFLFQALVALRKSTAELSYSSIYQHILTRFHVSWPQQTPMHYGNKHFNFFGNLRVGSDYTFVPVFQGKNKNLCLRAGHVHGVHQGDQYAVYPFDSAEDGLESKATIGELFAVDSVGCLTSELRRVRLTTAVSHVDDIGLKARLITQFPSSSIPARVPPEVLSWIKRERAEEQPNLVEYHVEESEKGRCMFNIRCNENGDYETLDAASRRIPNLPTIAANREEAFEEILNLLKHLAKFKRFEAVENRLSTSDFEQSFLVWSDATVGATGSYEVDHGNAWTFKIKNVCDKTIYLTVFDLYPSWDIQNLTSPSDGSFLVVEPGDEESVSINMSVPEAFRNGSRGACQDVIKVFITGSAIPFPSTILSPLDNPGSGGGMRNNSDQLSRCLLMLDSNARGTHSTIWANSWASRNFLVRTVAN